MEFAKKAVHYSFWYFLGAEGDKYIRAAGNALLEALERNAKEWEPSKWGPPCRFDRVATMWGAALCCPVM
jgi:hypothetical protein